MSSKLCRQIVGLLLIAVLLLTDVVGWIGGLKQTVSAATISITVTAQAERIPGFYWCQHLDDHWSTYSEISGTVTAADDHGEPRKTWVKTETTVAVPSGNAWFGEDGKIYNLEDVINPRPNTVVMNPDRAVPEMEGKPAISGSYVVIEGYSGQGVPGGYDGGKCGASPGMVYNFPIIVDFVGTVEIEIPDNGTHITRYYTTTGQSLASTFPSREIKMIQGETYNTDSPPTHPDYEYVGYKKTTSGTPPSGGSIVSGEPPAFAYTGDFDTYYLYRYYKPKVPDPGSGEIHVRHMVRTGSSGAFTKAGEELQIVESLPGSRTIQPESSYGELLGSNVYYSGYGSAYSNAGPVPVNLTAAQRTAYVSFYYEAEEDEPNEPGTFSGDFEVVPGTITYRDPFELVPTDFEMNGCEYQSHRYRIVHVATGTTSNVNAEGMTTPTKFVHDTYPNAIKTGTHQVYLKIFTDCGESEWIGPKPLEVETDDDNRPPVFQIAFVDPSNPRVPVYTAQEGDVLDLVYIDDPSVPTPYDPDGDRITFRGFDFSESTDWAKTIPQRGLSGITMSQHGMHANIKGTMCDELGACSEATTYIRVIPPNPVPLIDGPERVVEGRPYEGEFDSSRSYSPVGRSINHSRDEWTNVREIYPTPGQEIITLHVYDSIGLKSVAPDRYELTVLEDLPPEVKLIGSRTAVRNTPFTYTVEASSPDGDQIVKRTVQRRYDAANDGSFTNDSPLSISINGQYKFTETFSRVGKYQYEVCAEEDWGKRACTLEIVDVVNDAPFVTFDIQSTVQQPVAIPKIPLAAEKFMLSTWKNTDIATNNKVKAWSANPSTGALGAVPYTGGLEPQPTLSQISRTYSAQVPGEYEDAGTGWQNASYRTEFLNDDFLISWSHYRMGYYHDIYVIQRSNGSRRAIEDRDLIALNRQEGIVVLRAYNGGNLTYEWYTFDALTTPSGVPYQTTTKEPTKLDLTSALYDYAYDDQFYAWSNLQAPVSATLPTSVREWASNLIMTDRQGYWYFNNEDYPRGLDRYNPITKEVKRVVSFVPPYHIVYEVMVSPDGRYALIDGGTSFIGVVNLTTGNVAQNLTGEISRYWVWNQYGEHLLFQNTSQGQTVAYKWGSSGLTKLWEKDHYLQALVVNQDSQGFYLTHADGLWRTYELRKVNLDTGAESLLKFYDPFQLNSYDEGDVSGSILNGTAIGSALQISFRLDRSGRTEQNKVYLESGTTAESSTVPLLTDNQLIGGPNLDNVEIQFRMRLNQVPSSLLYSGFAYKMQDHRNLYRVELNLETLRLVKVVNGKRTVIKSVALDTQPSSYTPIRIHVLDDRHRIYVNGAPLIDVMDSTFSGGQFGPYAGIPRTEFDQVLYADLAVLSNELRLTNVALVDTDVEYQTTSEDAE
ncbi:hypothetical protein IDH44_25410, partial [Paenibacillus sp. IB182496]|nr:hypothetical protein [Paenibacillus sabuli]